MLKTTSEHRKAAVRNVELPTHFRGVSLSRRSGVSLCGISTVAQANRQGAFSYSVTNGKLKFSNSMSTKGTWDVVVTTDGKLMIGDGHYKMSNSASEVLAAGSITVSEAGVVTSYSNNSGHYKSKEEGLAAMQRYLLNTGLITTKTTAVDVSK